MGRRMRAASIALCKTAKCTSAVGSILVKGGDCVPLLGHNIPFLTNAEIGGATKSKMLQKTVPVVSFGAFFLTWDARRPYNHALMEVSQSWDQTGQGPNTNKIERYAGSKWNFKN